MKQLLHYWKYFLAAMLVGAALGLLGSQSPPVAPAPTPAPAPPSHQSQPASPIDSLSSLRNSQLPGQYSSTTGKQHDLVARFWARAAPEEFLAHLTASDPPFFSNSNHALYLFDSWAKRDFAAAFQASLELPAFNPLRVHIQHRVIAKQFARDPGSAIASLRQVWANNGSYHSEIIPFLDDPEEALSHLAELPKTDVAASAIARSLSTWAEVDPRGAFQWARANASSPHYIVATAWRSDPALGVDLLSEITSPRARAATARNLAVNHLRTDSPELSVDIIDGFMEGWSRHEAARKFGEKLAWKYPKETAELALTFKSPAAREAALTAALTLFERDAPQSLQLWVSNLPEGPSRNSVLAVYAELKASSAPPAEKP